MSKITRIENHIDFKELTAKILQANEDLSYKVEINEVGEVHSIADGIAVVRGMHGVTLEEVVKFDSGSIGIVKELLPYQIKVALFNNFDSVTAGMKVSRSGSELKVPVSEHIIGRVIDVFGKPIDGLDPIMDENAVLMAIERPAPKLMDRYPVSRPLTTGIIAIDSMIPIGLGQRELILGDMQTGKTSIAIGTIMNQLFRYKAGRPMYCFYVAIGQKMDNIVEVYKKLRDSGAMNYTTIIAASASDSAHTQFIAPYAGCTMAEFFMEKGHDCLVVYDDLSKHAVAHREISRLLGRPAGRDAYPADSFYIHARLLERSAYLRKEVGGGSLTALPIIETQDSDISGYIPTNVISITDGQVVLNARQISRPAIDVGLSVSRTGGAAQAPGMKKVSKSMKSELAQYSELVKFLQFTSGGLDNIQTKIMNKGLQTKYLITQEEDERYNMEESIILIAGAHYGIFASARDDKKELRKIKKLFLDSVHNSNPQIFKEISVSSDISDSSLEILKQIASKLDMSQLKENKSKKDHS